MRLRSVLLAGLARRLSPDAARELLLLLQRRGALSEGALRRLTIALYESDRHRRVFVDELKERIKAGSPGVDRVPFDLPADGGLEFEHLAGLFSSTCLDEFVITMNLRQSAYLFGLIRRMQCGKVIEIGRQWGGSTLLIAAAMQGRGRFWSIDDPHRLQYDLEVRGRRLARPVEHQVADVCGRLGLQAEILVDDPRKIEVETGEVDLVFIDGDHSFDGAMSDFERFGLRTRVGGAVLFDDAVHDDFSEPSHTADVKRVVREVARRGDFRLARTVKRLVHFERISK